MSQIAVVSNGILTLVSEEGKKQQHYSDFGADIERRMDNIAQKRSWKQESSGMFGPDATWGGQARELNLKPRIVAAIAGSDSEHFSYILVTESVGAFLKFNISEDYETRVFHKENFFASQLDRDPNSQSLVCSIQHDHSSSQIARMNPEGRDLQPLTEGDSLDGAPSWDRSNNETILFHSAGLAYNQHGYTIGTGPHSLEKIDLQKQRVTTILESEEQDYLCPRTDTDGNLYYITRPYEGPNGAKPSILTTVKDVFLFPVRLVRAFVDFFQMFSQIVSKKPLSTAGGPKKQGPEPVALWIHGRLLKPEDEDSNGALAPSSWKLMKQANDGETTTLASHVVSYDINTKGEIVYSDGKNIKILSNGKANQLTKVPQTEEVRWL